MSETNQETMYAYVMRQLESNKGRLRNIASDLKMSKSTVYAMLAKRNENPSVHTVQKLHDYFKKSAD